MDYGQYLTDDQKRSILGQRLTQFAAEAYQHEINKQVAVASNNTEAVAAADAALVIIDEAILVHEAELAKLTSPADPAV